MSNIQNKREKVGERNGGVDKERRRIYTEDEGKQSIDRWDCLFA
jgi:hypothetical protein